VQKAHKQKKMASNDKKKKQTNGLKSMEDDEGPLSALKSRKRGADKLTNRDDTKRAPSRRDDDDGDGTVRRKRTRLDQMMEQEQRAQNRMRGFFAAQTEEEKKALAALQEHRKDLAVEAYTSTEPIHSSEALTNGEATVTNPDTKTATIVQEWTPAPKLSFKLEAAASTSMLEHIRRCFGVSPDNNNNNMKLEQLIEWYRRTRTHERTLLDHRQTMNRVLSVRNNHDNTSEDAKETGVERILLAVTADLLIALNPNTRQLEAAWHAVNQGHPTFHALGIELPSPDCIVTADGACMALSTADGCLRFITMNRQQTERPMVADVTVLIPPIKDWQTSKPPLAASICFSESYVVALYERKCLYLFDRKQGKNAPIVDATSREDLRPLVDGVCCAIDRETVFVGNARGQLWCFGLKNRNVRPMLYSPIHQPLPSSNNNNDNDNKLSVPEMEESILSICVKGRRVAAASRNKVRLWDATLEVDNVPRVMDLPWSNVVGMRFAGNLLVAQTTIGVVIVLDMLQRTKERAQFYWETYHPSSQTHFDNVAVSLNDQQPFIACIGTGGLVTYIWKASDDELHLLEQARRALEASDAELEASMSRLQLKSDDEKKENGKEDAGDSKSNNNNNNGGGSVQMSDESDDNSSVPISSVLRASSGLKEIVTKFLAKIPENASQIEQPHNVPKQDNGNGVAPMSD
jgi:hypothetical protein